MIQFNVGAAIEKSIWKLVLSTSRVGSELARLCLSTLREVDRCDKDEMTSSYNLDKLARCLTVIRLEVRVAIRIHLAIASQPSTSNPLLSYPTLPHGWDQVSNESSSYPLVPVAWLIHVSYLRSQGWFKVQS